MGTSGSEPEVGGQGQIEGRQEEKGLKISFAVGHQALKNEVWEVMRVFLVGGWGDGVMWSGWRWIVERVLGNVIGPYEGDDLLGVV